MLQIIQHVKTGELLLEDFPNPILKGGCVLVANRFSLLSPGTEKSIIESTSKSLFSKAKEQPQLVKEVLNNAITLGPTATYSKVMSKLDKHKELGYSSAGIVLESSIPEFRPGDYVSCGGLTATHSEIVVVPKNLCAKIPCRVTFEEAAFTTLGAIALQGVRQANLNVGENACVIGLGLIGLLTIQILKSSGVNVIGLDINSNNFRIAESIGIDETAIIDEDSFRKVENFTNGIGTDSVLITAGTSSNEPIEYALKYARKKSSIVIVGAVGMNIPRQNFYEKEIDIKISCSYGPGRYDNDYEQKGIDYPVGYVRWTEKRNMESFLDMVSKKRIDLISLITHRFGITEALKGYDLIIGKNKEKYLGILIEYKGDNNTSTIIKTGLNIKGDIKSRVPVIGFIGAGEFAQASLLPYMSGYRLRTLVSGRPNTAKKSAQKFKFENASTNSDDVFKDEEINTVFIATRHDLHYDNVIKAIKAGKNVFVEKPLAVTLDELNGIKEEISASQNNIYLMTGYNRRFSKVFGDIKKYFSNNKEPFVINYRINAGFIPKDHWVNDAIQGGRIIGEVCHFVDTIQYITDSLPVSVFAESLRLNNAKQTDNDNVSILIRFNDGSIGNITYIANGGKTMPKEYCEIFSASKSAIMDNFKEVKFYNNKSVRTTKYNGEKGHKEEIQHYFNIVSANEKPELTFESQYLTTLVTFKINESLKSNSVVKII